MEDDSEATPSAERDSLGQCSLDIELEALQSIYVNEVDIVRDENSTIVSINLHPATADKLDEQYVMMTLKFSMDSEYPHKVPEIQIRNPRGLSDDKLTSISQDLKSIAESKIGNSMLFEVIEAAKEHLTELNRPCGECAICLYSFSDEDVFTKTDCYHYFHSHCLARYARTALKSAEVESADNAYHGEEETPDKELLCPVCRLAIHFTGSEDSFPPPSLLRTDDDPVISQGVIEIQKKMADLFQKQVDKGGIIDLEAEKNKYLLEISQVPTRSAEAASPVDLPKEEETDDGVAQKEDGGKDSKSPSKTAVSEEDSSKSDKKYNKLPRNKYDPNKSSKRNDDSKSRYKSDRDRMPKGASGKNVRNEEDNYEEKEKSSGVRSESNSYKRSDDYERNSYKRNDRPNNYGPPRRYYDDDYGRGNYNRYSDYRGGNRGRGRYPSNGYDRHSYQDRGYRGRGGRPRYERETSDEQSYQKERPRKEKMDSKELKEQECPEGSSDRNVSSKTEKDLDKKSSDGSSERNEAGKTEKDPEKKPSDGVQRKKETRRDTQDSCPDRDSRNQKQEDEDGHENKEKGYKERKYQDRSQADSYQDRRNYSDRRYDERDTRPNRRGGYDTRDGYNRGSYRGSNRRPWQRSQHNRDFDVDEEASRGYDRQRYSDQRSAPRGNRGNPRRNQNFHEQDRPQRNERSESYSNGVEDSRDGKNLCTDRDSDVQVSEKISGGYGESVDETNAKKFPQRHEDCSRTYNKDRRNYNSQRESYRDSDRNRPNSEAQSDSPRYKRNERFNNDRPYRNNNDSYQHRNNYSRNYNGSHYQDTSNSKDTGESSSERTAAKPSNASSNPSASANEKELTHQEPTQSKVRSGSESLPKDPPSAKPTANFALGSPKMPQPPPGFSNPSKKVVYGLQAANPPPGFPRS